MRVVGVVEFASTFSAGKFQCKPTSMTGLVMHGKMARSNHIKIKMAPFDISVIKTFTQPDVIVVVSVF